MIRRSLQVLVVVFGVVMAGGSGACSGGRQQAAQSAPPASSGPAMVNIEEIFPPGKGRDLLLQNCTTCHTFVPIVILQMTRDAWERNGRDHRGRVTALSDADFKILYEYLMKNFNPDRPVPKLPKELLDTWTSY